MRKLAYKIFTFLSISLILFSCSKENGNYGSITFNIKGNVNISVNDNTTTKAESVNTDNFEIFLGSESLGLKKDLTTPIELGAGTYSVSAQSCSIDKSNEGDGLLRFYGINNNIIITGTESVTATIECFVVNSKVSIYLADSYKNYFDAGYTTVTISDGTRTITVVENGAVTKEAVYFNAATTLTVKVNSKKTSATGTEHSFDTTESFTSAAATWHKITINADLNSSGGITFTTQNSHVSDWISITDYIPGSVKEDE